VPAGANCGTGCDDEGESATLMMVSGLPSGPAPLEIGGVGSVGSNTLPAPVNGINPGAGTAGEEAAEATIGAWLELELAGLGLVGRLMM
jgi:hypothetical protein